MQKLSVAWPWNNVSKIAWKLTFDEFDFEVEKVSNGTCHFVGKFEKEFVMK